MGTDTDDVDAFTKLAADIYARVLAVTWNEDSAPFVELAQSALEAAEAFNVALVKHRGERS